MSHYGIQTPPDPCRTPVRCPHFSDCQTELKACYDFERYITNHTGRFKPTPANERKPRRTIYFYIFDDPRKHVDFDAPLPGPTPEQSAQNIEDILQSIA